MSVALHCVDLTSVCVCESVCMCVCVCAGVQWAGDVTGVTLC